MGVRSATVDARLTFNDITCTGYCRDDPNNLASPVSQESTSVFTSDNIQIDFECDLRAKSIMNVIWVITFTKISKFIVKSSICLVKE